MHSHQFNSPLGHHIRGHRRINTAADEHRRAAAGAGGHTPCAVQVVAPHKGVAIPYLYGNGNVRVMYIYLEMMKAAQNTTAHLSADLRRFHGEFFVAALGFYLKGFGVLQRLL